MLTIISINSKTFNEAEYIIYLLKKIRKYSSRIVACISVNADTRLLYRLQGMVDEVYSYATDIDINRYRDVILNKYGWDLVYGFERVLLLNDSCFGPFYSLDEFFYKVDDVDFWGITEHGPMIFDYPEGEKRYSRFLQSYFLVINSRMLNSTAFREYLEILPIFDAYEDAAAGFEYVFTSHFENLGFRWKAQIYTRDLEAENPRFFQSPILFNLRELIIERKYPFIPKICFILDRETVQAHDIDNYLMEILDYVENNSDYDIEMIYNNLIRSMDIHDILVNLNLNYVIKEKEENNEDVKIGVFAYLFYPDLFSYSLKKLSYLPLDSDIYVATNNLEKIEILRNMVKEIMPEHSVKIIIHSKRGRDISALLLTFKNYILNYDLACFIHDKKSSQLDYTTVGKAFNQWIWENMLCSCGYINGVINLFETNRHLGYLAPPPVYHSTYFKTSLDTWTICFDATKDLAKRIGINLKMDRTKGPDFLGSAFWFRPVALKKLLEYNFKENDFPEEPMPPDGSFNHAMERIFPYIVQNAGYMSGIIMTNDYAAVNYNNYRENINHIMNLIRRRVESVDTSTAYTTIRTLERN